MCECSAVFAWEWGCCCGEIAWCGLVLAVVVLRDVIVLLGHGLVLLLLHIRLAALWVEGRRTVLGGGEARALAASKADPDHDADESENDYASSSCDSANDRSSQARVVVVVVTLG